MGQSRCRWSTLIRVSTKFGPGMLRVLDLHANQLTTLPAALADLMHLEKLDLRWNRLTSQLEWVD